jgi:hypothetical protein
LESGRDEARPLVLAGSDQYYEIYCVNNAVTWEGGSGQMQRIGPPELRELSRKTGLVLRPVDSGSVNRLFAELEKYDPQERVETFEYLKRALNETRAWLGAELTYIIE